MEYTEKNNMTVEEASKLMGVGRQFIREGLKQKKLPFGDAVQIQKGGKYTYFISRQKFYEYIGIKGEAV